MDVLLVLRLPAVPASAVAARHAVLALAPGLINEAVAEDVALLVTELMTNSLRHSGCAGSGSVDVSLRASGRALMVEVADSGRGFEGFRPCPAPVEDPARPATGGYGLLLVERIADRWGIVDPEGEAGVRVWFELERPTAPTVGCSNGANGKADVLLGD